MKLFILPNCPFCKRVLYFVQYKSLPVEIVTISPEELPLYSHATVPIMQWDDGTTMNDSIPLIREIEYRFPHPIGFVGPVEPRMQWASMIISKMPGYKDICMADEKSESLQQIFTTTMLPLMEEIQDLVEDDFFIMGPTFSVADCILAADLSPLLAKNFNGMPPEIPAYCKRVLQKCQIR